VGRLRDIPLIAPQSIGDHLLIRECPRLLQGQQAAIVILSTVPVVIEWIRRLEPRVVITHWPDARHPDHASAAQLVRSASFPGFSFGASAGEK